RPIDLLGSFKINGHEPAIAINDQIGRFAVSPGPAGAMHLRKESRDFNSERQDAFDRESSFSLQQQVMEAVTVNKLHCQIDITFHFEPCIDVRHTDAAA